MARNGQLQKNPWAVRADDSKGGGDFEKPPEGNHTSVLVALIDLGTHDREYKGKHRDEHQIQLVWELVDETKQDGTPHVMGEQYAFFEDMSKKSNLRLLLEAWRGKPYKDGEEMSLDKLLGQACQLNLGDKDGYIKILSIAPVPKRTAVSKPRLPLFHWSFGYDEPARIPDWVPWIFGKPTLEVIKASREWAGTSEAVPEARPSRRAVQPASAPQGKGESALDNDTDDEDDDDLAPF